MTGSTALLSLTDEACNRLLLFFADEAVAVTIDPIEALFHLFGRLFLADLAVAVLIHAGEVDARAISTGTGSGSGLVGTRPIATAGGAEPELVPSDFAVAITIEFSQRDDCEVDFGLV